MGAQSAKGSNPESRDEPNQRYDFPRLERAVEALLEAQDRLREQNAELRASLEARDARIDDLEAGLRDQQQRRADAIARIDLLIGQLEDLDARLERAEGSKAAELAAGANVGSVAP